MSPYSLFDTVYAKESGGDYGSAEVSRAARPHINYLSRLQKWHRDHSVSWDVVYPHDGGANGQVRRAGDGIWAPRGPRPAASLTAGRAGGGGAPRRTRPTGQAGKSQHQSGVPVSLEGIDDAKFDRIADEIEASQRVYEHDQGEAERAQRGDVIKVTRLDKGERLLWLERPPRKPRLKVSHNTHQIDSMSRALKSIVHRPHRSHMPLRALFRETGARGWPGFRHAPVDKWFFLNRDVEGLDCQRRFVRMALGTPDFAFLEGPPGSGKTTALCELVMQMVLRGKRVLFCASTHVAVDNLLERLAGAGDEVRDRLTAIRIGTSDKISDEASRCAHDRVAEEEEKNIRLGLAEARARSKAQESMRGILGDRNDAIGRMVRDHANLVCGTTIGILAHPDIKDKTLRRFDMMILDEASKTTLQEFFVPAVHAGRWVIVGDTRQLVPHVDQDDMALQVEACMDKARGEACLDAFMAKKRGQTTVVSCPDPDAERAYAEQCKKLGVRLRRPGDGGTVGRGEVLVGPAKKVARAAPRGGNVVWRGSGARAGPMAGPARRGRPPGGGDATWASEVAWRISMHGPGVEDGQDGGSEKLRGDVDMLMPQPDDVSRKVRAWLSSVRRIAVPSVLELLQSGFPEGPGGVTLLDCGMPKKSFEKRHVLLEWQHRMHSDIAGFSHRHVYGGRALRTPDSMADRRAWAYGRYSSRAVWIDVQSGTSAASGSPSNAREAECVDREIREFVKFARDNPRPDGGLWEVAVLPFYTGQLRLLQERMRRASPRGGPYTFQLPPGKPCVSVKIRTVDSFQGHEADFVLLSTVNSYPTTFLRNPNRLNVALTRARYQCVVVGSKRAMSKDSLLDSLAREMPCWPEAKK